jgi:hypothetical protein
MMNPIDWTSWLMIRLLQSAGGTPEHGDTAVFKCGHTFAYRATDKRRLRLIVDPIGPDNDKHLIAMAKKTTLVVFAYGQAWSPDVGAARYRRCETPPYAWHNSTCGSAL